MHRDFTLSTITQKSGSSVDADSQKLSFTGRIVIIGAGSISKCLQPLLLRHLNMDFSKVTILDMTELKDSSMELIAAGARYLQTSITRHNLDETLSQLLSKGDLLIDLAWNISTIALIDWCQANDVLYVNSSLEVWECYKPDSGIDVDEDSIYTRYVEFKKYVESKAGGTTTAIIEHGCNPGLVNHWVKRGLEDVGKEILARIPLSLERRSALEDALNEKDYARLAQATGTKVIHISERDTQVSSRAIDYENEFVNTWSPASFQQESLSPAELAFGTHERELPEDAGLFAFGPRNKIYLNRMSKDALSKSWVPSGEIVGQVSPHGEVFTISEHLTVKEGDSVVYRPSVYFVYKPCDQALGCLARQESKGYKLPENKRVMTDEIVSGRDEVGVLLLGHDLNGWWVGSRLDIHETRKHVSGQNATTLQVAASLLSAIVFAIKNPTKGICTADELPHKEILSVAEQYLGPCPSVQTNWTPEQTQSRRATDKSWQLKSFLLADETGRRSEAV